MSERENELRIRTGRIKDRGLRPGRAKSFFDKVARAAKRAGHSSARASRYGGNSTFGRGRAAYAKAALGNPSRRVIVKARIVRHRGTRFRSASLATHLSYLQRDGTDRDGHEGILFDADGEDIDGRSFATSCENDRHHFRFIVSPEEANEMRDLRGFTRDLMHQAESDLETRLEWAAVAHHNTDNPHVHILVRGVDERGGDLVISRDYIGRGLRARAEGLVSLELGPRSEQEIDSSLAREVTADRWTKLDHSLQLSADDNGGILDLRPATAQTEKRLQSHLLGRAQHLENLGLATSTGPAQWMLEPNAETTLRDLGQRGDIIKTMHDALTRGGPATLYLIVPPSDISRTKPLVRLILNQIGRRLTEELDAGTKRHKILLMLDEFPALGKLDFFESALAFMAGYGVRAFLIAQSLNQIEKAYGANNAILDNCHVRVSFATNDERTAKRISDALGTATEMRAMKNYAGHRLSPWLGHLMVSRQETARFLLTPGEVMQLPPTNAIVMVSGVLPILAQKARYYEDRQLTARIMSPPNASKNAQNRSGPIYSDDWSGLGVPRLSAPKHSARETEDTKSSTGGLRREPELSDEERVIPKETPDPVDEFEGLEDDGDRQAIRARIMQERAAGLSRQVTLDPDDGMDL